jgi:hypothetical protein
MLSVAWMFIPLMGAMAGAAHAAVTGTGEIRAFQQRVHHPGDSFACMGMATMVNALPRRVTSQ